MLKKFFLSGATTLAVLAGVLAAGPAHAAQDHTAASPSAAANTDWSGTVAGSRGLGVWWYQNGNEFKNSFNVYDTADDKMCAFVISRPQVYNERLSIWMSTGLSGTEIRTEVCGWGNSKGATHSYDFDTRLNAQEKLTTSKIRVLIRVCLNKPAGGDPCDDYYTPARDF